MTSPTASDLSLIRDLHSPAPVERFITRDDHTDYVCAMLAAAGVALETVAFQMEGLSDVITTQGEIPRQTRDVLVAAQALIGTGCPGTSGYAPASLPGTLPHALGQPAQMDITARRAAGAQIDTLRTTAAAHLVRMHRRLGFVIDSLPDLDAPTLVAAVRELRTGALGLRPRARAQALQDPAPVPESA